jgi:hypothetical protein
MNYSQYVIPVLLIAFILYRRVKRSIGFQAYHQKRLVIRSTILLLIGLLLLGVSAIHPVSYIYEIAGSLLGSALLIMAIKWSRFETRQGTIYYRTHIWIETFVLFVFLSRFLYRMFYLFQVSGKQAELNSSQMNMQYTKDPLTMGVYFLLVVYYVGYAFYVIRKARGMAEENRQISS